MLTNQFLNGLTKFAFFLLLTACANSQIKNNFAGDDSARLPSEAKTSPKIKLLPQEQYGDAVLDLLDRKGKEGLAFLQFSFFTDNGGKSYPKQIAQKLVDIKRQNPGTSIVVALESRKDAMDPAGKGIAQRNAKTKRLLESAGIKVADVYGQTATGVSHTKLAIVADEIIAGSTNLTKQSTDPDANNEMNLLVQSEKISNALRGYVDQIIAKPGQMIDMEVEDGELRLLTDRLHFNELISQIKKSQKGDQIGLAMYQFLYRNEKDLQAKQVFQELVSAHNRGVQVEIYLNRAQDLATQNTAANLHVAELLLQEGISKVYFDPEAKISHSKFFYRIASAEKVAIISSVNIYKGDFTNNHQLSWVIRNNPVIDSLTSYFKHQLAYDGVLVSRIPKDTKTGWKPPLAPQRMLRFWRGFKQDHITRTEFESQVNSRLFPETFTVGVQRGLNAYLPSFYLEDKPDFIPDEVAIIDYASEETYNAIRTTERGRKYGPLHFEEGLFAKKNGKGFSSASLVASTYTGEIEINPNGHAYMLGKPSINWQNDISVRRTLLPISNLTVAQVQQFLTELEKNFANLGINGMVVVVDPNYLILMLNLKNLTLAQVLDEKLNSIETGIFKKLDHIVFANQNSDSHVASGTGSNFKFNAELKTRDELIQLLLKEM